MRIYPLPKTRKTQGFKGLRNNIKSVLITKCGSGFLNFSLACVVCRSRHPLTEQQQCNCLQTHTSPSIITAYTPSIMSDTLAPPSSLPQNSPLPPPTRPRTLMTIPDFPQDTLRLLQASGSSSTAPVQHDCCDCPSSISNTAQY